MDISIQDERLADQAVGKLFGDDISTGPRRDFPEALSEVQRVIKGVARLRLTNPLPAMSGERPAAWAVYLHPVMIKHNGDDVGTAWRMDEQSLRDLASWEAACAQAGKTADVFIQ